MTKHEAQIRKKMTKNNSQDKSGTKYSKSNSFFKNLNERDGVKPGKPNANLNKMKI